MMTSTKRLLAVFLSSLALLCLAGVGTILWMTELRADEARSEAKADMQRATASIEKKRQARLTELASSAATPSMLEAFRQLDSGYRAYIPEHLRDLYVAVNPHAGFDLSLLSDPKDGSQYSQAHAVHHPWLRKLSELRGLRDLLLIRDDGEVIYSVKKHRAFAQQLSAESFGGDAPMIALHKARLEVARSPEGATTGPVPALTGEAIEFALVPLEDEKGNRVASVAVEYAAIASPRVASAASAISQMRADAGRSIGLLSLLTLVIAGVGFQLIRRGSISTQELASQAEGLRLERPQEEEMPESQPQPGSYRSGTRIAVSLAPDGKLRATPEQHFSTGTGAAR